MDYFLRHLGSVQRHDASCDYTLRSEPSSLSPRSDGYNLTDIMKKESSTTKPPFAVTTGLTVSTPHVTTPESPAKQTSEVKSTLVCDFKTETKLWKWKMWMLVIVVAGFGVIVGVTFVGVTLLCTKRRTAINDLMCTSTFSALLPPKLTVNPAVITETDSVTLNCQTPSSVSVSQCYFHFVRGGPSKSFPCLQTLTGSELLKMSHQSSPAEVKVTCFYLYVYQSPESDVSSIIVRRQKPEMSLQHFHGEHVLFTCTVPGSADPDTTCNLYFGESSHPVQTQNILTKRNSTNQWFCWFTVTIEDLLRRLRSVPQPDASCDYSSRSELNSYSPRSDGRSLTDIVEKESRVTQTMTASTVTTGLRVSTAHTSTPVTSAKQTSVVHSMYHEKRNWCLFVASIVSEARKRIWRLTALASGCGVTLGIILMVSALRCNRRRSGENFV
ncbi:hypothetical protein GBF38_013463 [Nibea albiflora]|uniref:Uncharacterized protein n=1 Tax=Nibea albiflora TaxID=240163 RepID=A0ACB7F1I6_NIBAL|nr:hypothetical protein GBF38_013463 [Nibea albiflora]